MGFMDKVKEQAAVATAAAKDAAQKGSAKVDELQAKRAADGVLRQLGLASYLVANGRGGAQSEDEIKGFIATLQQYETEHGPLEASDNQG
jgi:hypothetical protein